MESYWDLVKEIIRESDIVLEILDARFPELSRNKEAEDIITLYKRPRILVLNKADLVKRKELEYSVDALVRETGAQVVYVTNRQSRTIKNLLACIRRVFALHGKRKEFINQPIIKKPFREAKADVIVGVIGYPNVGKSSIINSLAFKKKMTVSKKAGTTHGVHWIKANDEIKLIDTPGVIPLNSDTELKLGLIAARSPEKIKDHESLASKIIEMFLTDKKIDRLEQFYNITLEKTTIDSNEPSQILEEIALKKHHLGKGGIADLIRTSVMIIRDWQQGKLRL